MIYDRIIYFIVMEFDLLGHSRSLHETDSVFEADPGQVFPLCFGAGLSHDRVRTLVLVPVPQDLSQLDQLDQDL